MAYQSRLELIVDGRSGERELGRFENSLERVDRAGGQASESIGGMNSRMESISRVAKVAGGALLGLTAGAGVFTAIARNASQSAREIQNFANLANTTTQEFQRMSFASTNFGVEQEKLADILKDVNDRVGEFMQTGSGEMKDFFENIAPKVGVTADQFARLSGPEALQLYYQSLEDANLSQQEMTFYMESMADEASALIPLLQNNSAELDRLTGEADKLDAVLSDMEIQRLRDIRGEFGQLEQQLSTETMRAVSQFDELMKSSLEGISYGINNVARGFNVFMDSFRDGEAKRSIAGIDAELNALFDNRDRLQQRIDMFGADSAQAQDSILAMQELRAQYTVLIDRKKELQQAGLPVEEPEIVQLDRASTSTDKLTKAQKDAIKEANNHAEALNGLLNEADPLRAAHEEYTESLETLNRGLSEGTITTEEYGEALRWAAGEYTDIASGADDAKKALEQLTQQYDSQYQRGVQLTQAISDISAAYRRGDIDGRQYGRMTQGVRDEMAELALEADPMAQEMARAWEEATNRIDETFSDAFAGAFDSFDSFADQLLDGFKRLLAELAYQATLKPIVVGFTGDMQSMMSGGGGGFGNTISAARGVMKGSSLFGGGSTAVAAGGLYSGASTGAAVGGLYGNAATGGLASTGLASSITSGISAAMPWLAGGALVDNVLGLGIVDGITDAIGGLFGSKKTFDFDFEQGATGAEFGQRNTALGNSGVVSLTDFKLEQQAEFDEMLNSMAALDNTLAAAALPARLDAMKASVEGFSQSGADKLFENRLRAIIDGSGAIAEEALLKIVDPEQLAQAFQSVLSLEGIAAGIGGALLGDIESEISKQDAGSVAAVVRSLTEGARAAVLLGDNTNRLNLIFDVTASRAIHAANNIQEMVGGVDQLASLQSSYYQAFFTDAERAADLQDDLTQSLRAIGMELPATRDGFRALVEAQDLNTVAGRENYATLLQLAGGFDQLKQMMGEVGDVAGGVTADLSGVESAWKQFSKAIDAERDILKSAHDQTTASIRSNMSTIQDAMRTTERVAGSLQSTLDQMMGNSVIDQRGRFDSARGYLSQTLNSGGLGDPDQLERALSVVSQPSEDMYSTLQDYQRDFLSTANIVDQLNDRADAQLTTEERGLRALERQLEQADLQFDREMAALDEMKATEQASLEAQFGQLDWLSTLNDSVLSITDALGALDSAAAKASGGATSSAINRAYQDILGRDADDSGLAYYAGAGFSLSEIRARLRDSDEATGKLPGFADGGIANGPTSGYPVELHGPEAIIPLSGGNIPLNVPGIQALVREVSQLRSELRDSQRAIAEYSRKAARVLEREELERRQQETV